MAATAPALDRLWSTPNLRFGHPVRMLFSRRPWIAALFLLCSFALGVAWFTVLTTLVSTGLGLAITLVGLPILGLTLLLTKWGAQFERWRLNVTFGVDIPSPYRPMLQGPFKQQAIAFLRDPAVWRDVVYLVLLFPIGIAELIVLVLLTTIPLTLFIAPLLAPVTSWLVPELSFGSGRHIVFERQPIGSGNDAAASTLLVATPAAPAAPAEPTAPKAPAAPIAPLAPVPPLVPEPARAYGNVNRVTLEPAVNGRRTIVVEQDQAIARIELPSVQFRNHSFVDGPGAVAISLFLGLPLMLLMPFGLVATARAHLGLGRLLLGPTGSAVLAARVENLTESRSRVVDAALAERRRIERDLHDGAQQRLVALAMNLGMARAKFDSDPEAARGLIENAHTEAKLAMAELRHLIQGLHPAVLTDRGLDAALSALSARCPVPVAVIVDLDRRPPAAVESAAYFFVAEALTNITKHSLATEAAVVVNHRPGMLVVEVSDNGIGGVDTMAGSGLRGLADRVAALDGTMRVESPPGGGTRLCTELPCAW